MHHRHAGKAMTVRFGHASRGSFLWAARAWITRKWGWIAFRTGTIQAREINVGCCVARHSSISRSHLGPQSETLVRFVDSRFVIRLVTPAQREASKRTMLPACTLHSARSHATWRCIEPTLHSHHPSGDDWDFLVFFCSASQATLTVQDFYLYLIAIDDYTI